MCLFDCKCNNWNRLGEHITNITQQINIHKTEKLRDKHTTKNINTGYPAQDPTANMYHNIYSRRFVGWISFTSVVYMFLEAFLFHVCCFMSVFQFSPSLCKVLHLQSNKHIQTQKTTKTRLSENIQKKKTNKHKYIISQPEPERYVFAVGSWAGYPVFLLLMFLSKLFCYISVVFCCSVFA